MLKIYTDGASRSNPGKASIGIIMFENDKVIFKRKEFLGIKTNNVAEYTAMFKALSKAKTITKGELECYSDSQLMIMQLNGIYKVNNSDLKELHDKIKMLLPWFKKVHFKHVKREDARIQMADKLANEALDESKL